MGIATIIAAGSSLLSGISALQQSQYQAAVASANKQIAEQNAQLAIDIGGSNLEDLSAENEGRLGLQAARMGSSGIAISSPSFEQARSRGKQLHLTESRRIMESAYREAANYKSQANLYAAEAKANKSAGAMGLFSGFLSAVGAGLRGQARQVAYGGPTTGPFDLLRRKDPNSKWFNYGSGFNTGY